jgi:hypothetical protein
MSSIMSDENKGLKRLPFTTPLCIEYLHSSQFYAIVRNCLQGKTLDKVYDECRKNEVSDDFCHVFFGNFDVFFGPTLNSMAH